MKLETKVGAFFIGTLAILGVLILRTKKISLFSERPAHTFNTEFEQVAGLTKQGNVCIAGVKVGEVTAIAVNGNKALVTFKVYEPTPVYRNAMVRLSSISILGEKFIALQAGDAHLGTMPQNSYVPSQPSISMDKLMETVGGISNDVKGITASLNHTLGGEAGQAKLDEIVDNLRGITGEFRAMAQENHGAINATLANAENITRDLQKRLPLLAQQFEDVGKNLNGLIEENRPEFKGLMGDLRKLAQNFHESAENVRLITARVNKGDGTIGKLLTDETTINKLNTAVDNVNDMLTGMKKMDLTLDLNGASWTRRGDSQVGLSVDLIPRKDYWYHLGVNSTPDGKYTDYKTTVMQGDPPQNVTQHTRTIINDQAMTLTATFNKRLGKNLVVQAGIMDGRGGAGAELRYFDDRFRVGALAYDFSKRNDKKNPRYRFTTSYEFIKGLYLQAGMQDIANSDFRTFFAGAGVRWKDEDLKKLFGLAGMAK